MTDLDDLVDEMSALLGAPCVLEDPDFRLIASSGQTDVDDVRLRSILERRSTNDVRDWFHAQDIRTSPVPLRTPAQPSLGIVERVCVPARHLNRVHGYFWLLDPDGTIAEESLPAAARLAEVAAMLLSQSTRHQTRLNLFFRELIEGDRTTARSAARELSAASGLGIDDEVTCVMLEHAAPQTESPITQPRVEGSVWLEETTTASTILVRGRVAPDLLTFPALLTRLGLRTRRRREMVTTRAGVGPWVQSLEQVRRGHWGARTALRVAGHGEASDVVHWSTLGPLRLLAAAPDQDLTEALTTDRLDAFIHDPHRAELVRTARLYLDTAGSVAQTSAALNIHRQTLYHRLAQVEHWTGLSLKKGTDRTLLHLALLLASYMRPDSTTQ